VTKKIEEVEFCRNLRVSLTFPVDAPADVVLMYAAFFPICALWAAGEEEDGGS
jgi:hypothetical protein